MSDNDVKFYTALADELTEEPPDTDDEKRLSQRLYLGKQKIE